MLVPFKLVRTGLNRTHCIQFHLPNTVPLLMTRESCKIAACPWSSHLGGACYYSINEITYLVQLISNYAVRILAQTTLSTMIFCTDLLTKLIVSNCLTCLVSINIWKKIEVKLVVLPIGDNTPLSDRNVAKRRYITPKILKTIT